MSLKSKQIKYPDVKEQLVKLRNVDLENATNKKDLLTIGHEVIRTLFYLYLMKKYSNNFCVFLREQEEYTDDLNGNVFEFGLFITLMDGAVNRTNSDYSVKHLGDQFNSCLTENSNPIILIPLDIQVNNSNNNSKKEVFGHSNMLIYRKFNNTIEHYDPHGEHLFTEDYESEYNLAIRNLIDRFLKEVNFGKVDFDIITLVNSEQSCIKLPEVRNGFQSIENSVNDVGYCLSWSFFMFEMTLLNPEFTSREIQHQIIFEIFGQQLDSMNMDSDYLPNYLVAMIRGYSIIMSNKIKKYFTKIFFHSINEENLNNPNLRLAFFKDIVQFISMFLQYNKTSDNDVKHEIKTVKKGIKTITKKQNSKASITEMFHNENKKNTLITRKNQLETIRKLGRTTHSSIFSIDSKTSFHSSVSSFASDSNSSRGEDKSQADVVISKFDNMDLDALLSFLNGKSIQELEDIITHESFVAAANFFQTNKNDTEALQPLSQRFEKWCKYFNLEADCSLEELLQITDGDNQNVYYALATLKFHSSLSYDDIQISSQNYYKIVILTVLGRDPPFSGGNNYTKKLRHKNKKTKKKRKLFQNKKTKRCVF